MNAWGKEPAADDDLPLQEKAAASPRGSWYDLVCGVCDRRCCTQCTADGDYTRCSKTLFTSCSVCGHPSNGHDAVPH